MRNGHGVRSSVSEEPITLFVAKKIVTMDPATPAATAIAVQGDRIVGIGDRNKR